MPRKEGRKGGSVVMLHTKGIVRASITIIVTTTTIITYICIYIYLTRGSCVCPASVCVRIRFCDNGVETGESNRGHWGCLPPFLSHLVSYCLLLCTASVLVMRMFVYKTLFLLHWYFLLKLFYLCAITFVLKSFALHWCLSSKWSSLPFFFTIVPIVLVFLTETADNLRWNWTILCTTFSEIALTDIGIAHWNCSSCTDTFVVLYQNCSFISCCTEEMVEPLH